MVGVNIDTLYKYDANEFVLHMHVLLINVTINNQLFIINIKLQKHNCVNHFLLKWSCFILSTRSSSWDCLSVFEEPWLIIPVLLSGVKSSYMCGCCSGSFSAHHFHWVRYTWRPSAWNPDTPESEPSARIVMKQDLNYWSGSMLHLSTKHRCAKKCVLGDQGEQQSCWRLHLTISSIYRENSQWKYSALQSIAEFHFAFLLISF